MRKIIIGLLLAANIISLQYYESIKHKRDNFALCGSSIGMSYSDASSETDSKATWSKQAAEQKNISKQQSNNRLKEISIEIPDHVNLLTSAYNHDDLIISSFTNFKENNSNSSLFIKTVFRPS